MPGMREKWAVVTLGYFNTDSVLRTLDQRKWSASIAKDLTQLELFVERGPQAVCILSVLTLMDLVKDMEPVLGKCVENGVARVAVVSLKADQVLEIWNGMSDRKNTELRAFRQPTSLSDLTAILDFVTREL